MEVMKEAGDDEEIIMRVAAAVGNPHVCNLTH